MFRLLRCKNTVLSNQLAEVDGTDKKASPNIRSFLDVSRCIVKSYDFDGTWLIQELIRKNKTPTCRGRRGFWTDASTRDLVIIQDAACAHRCTRPSALSKVDARNGACYSASASRSVNCGTEIPTASRCIPPRSSPNGWRGRHRRCPIRQQVDRASPEECRAGLGSS